MKPEMNAFIKLQVSKALENNRNPLVGDDGVPHCSYEQCAQYDGKRCRETGQRAGGLCEPHVSDMARDLAAYHAHYVTKTSADLVAAHLRGLLGEAVDIAARRECVGTCTDDPACGCRRLIGIRNEGGL